MSCHESLFSDNDSVRVGCSNDNVMTTIGEFEPGANDEPYVTHKNSVRKKKRKDKEIIYVV